MTPTTTSPDQTTQPWELCAFDTAQAATLANELDCPLPIAGLLVQRGFADAESARHFLSPSIDDLIDPMRMAGMAAAVTRIIAALQANEPILIYGDYDVDGTTATVILKIALERVAATLNGPGTQADVRFHVPHRIREGYGMQTGVLADAHLAGVRLVISVDTGIRAFAAAAECKSLGLDLIVTDHHLPDEAGIPEAVAVINPAQHGCTYPFPALCGAAVSFKLAHALLLRVATTPEQQERLRTALVPSFLKLVAIATIADSVPLLGENRTIVSLGLAALAKPVQPGLRELFRVSEIPADRPPTVHEIGFRLAPRINAAGRMDVASEVVELFLTRDAERARILAEKLDRLNEERRATEAEALHAIEATLLERARQTADRAGLLHDDAAPIYDPEVLLLDDPEWHRGVLGILASRVVERTALPALVMTHDEGQAHGSGRSVSGFHLLDALTAVHAEAEVFTRFGGHAHAVGFSLPSANLPLLRERMAAYATPLLSLPRMEPPLLCDHLLTLAEANETLHDWLIRSGPFGHDNPEPVWLLRNVEVARPVRWLQDRHLCLELRPAGSRSASGMRSLGWSRGRTDWRPLAESLDLQPGTALDVVCRLRKNTHPSFGGIELELTALRPARG